jgi:large subunit ribosomal protein L22
MISKAVARYLRVSPRKARIVIALIRGKYVNDALTILSNTNKRPALMLVKLLNSAIANAKRIPNIEQEHLYIANIFADGGPMLKRYKAQALGRASMIRRRTSHITLELDLKEPRSVKLAKESRKQKVKKPDMQKAKEANLKKPRADKAARVTKKEKRAGKGVKSGT